MTTQRIDFSQFSRTELQQLSRDVAEELVTREHDERIALEERLRTAVEEAGFDPAELQFGRTHKPKRKATKHSKGGSDEV